MATLEAATTGISFASSENEGPNTQLRSRHGDLRAPKTRRSSSLATDSSYDDAATNSSYVADAVESEVEVSLWYSVPLLFAIVPAIAGLAFQGASVVITDLALLVLAAVYLHWCLLTPWVWYHAAQGVTLANAASAAAHSDEVIEDEEETNGQQDDAKSSRALNNADKGAASTELRVHELLALSMCFVGPLLGAYILNLVRDQIAIGHDMVTNLHLTLFVLGAEIRPLRYCMKIIHARTLHLQRRVREDPYAIKGSALPSAEDMGKRIDALNASVAELTTAKPSSQGKATVESTDSLKKLQSGLQTQVDALNRAVRRYEKRATAQTIQTEARLQDLEFRLKDALSLAAVAAAYSQKPGAVVLLMEWFSWAATLPMKAVHAALMYPLRLVALVVNRMMIGVGLAKPVLPRRSVGKQAMYRMRDSDYDLQ